VGEEIGVLVGPAVPVGSLVGVFVRVLAGAFVAGVENGVLG
jgi:hypothetical protein